MKRHPQLFDPTFLRRRAGSGVTPAELASEVGCGETTARTALARYGLPTTSQARRLGEPPPTRLETAPPEHADLAADVADDELERRLCEGLVGLARLADMADRATRDAMWDSIIDIDPATARAITFTAATLVSEQRKSSHAGRLSPSSEE
jgi:hypothetical protein